jgi:hypothetical protein
MSTWRARKRQRLEFERATQERELAEQQKFKRQCTLVSSDWNSIEGKIPITIENYRKGFYGKNGQFPYLLESQSLDKYIYRLSSERAYLTDPTGFFPWRSPRPSNVYEIVQNEMITYPLYEKLFCCKIDYIFYRDDFEDLMTFSFYVDLRKELGHPKMFEILGGMDTLKKLLDLSCSYEQQHPHNGYSDDDHLWEMRTIKSKFQSLSIVPRALATIDGFEIESEQHYILSFREKFKMYYYENPEFPYSCDWEIPYQ